VSGHGDRGAAGKASSGASCKAMLRRRAARGGRRHGGVSINMRRACCFSRCGENQVGSARRRDDQRTRRRGAPRRRGDNGGASKYLRRRCAAFFGGLRGGENGTHRRKTAARNETRSIAKNQCFAAKHALIIGGERIALPHLATPAAYGKSANAGIRASRRALGMA